MRKIALRNFIMTSLTILICIVIFLSLLLVQLYRYSINEKYKSLERDCRSVSYLALIWMTEPYKLDTNALRDVLKLQAAIDNTRMMISDANGEIKMFADSYNSGKGGYISNRILSSLKTNGLYSESGTFDGYYANQLITVAMPIRDAADNLRGAVIVSSSAEGITLLFKSFLRDILPQVLFVLTLSALLIYFVSQRLSRPLKEIATATKDFAMGDYSARVSIYGRDEIAELACSFNYMADTMEKLDKHRSEFIANVSHELKTPMTTIGGFINGILDGTISKEQEQKYLKIVSAEVQRLSRMISKLLLATRLQTSGADENIPPIDICSILSAVVVGAEGLINDKNMNVNIDFPRERVYVNGDADALTQVVTNLLDNAIKYGDEGGIISFTVAIRNDRVFVSIFNTGLGISPDDIPFLFDRFYKSDRSRGEDKQSTGLGLYIVKSILKNMNQEIRVESEHGKWIRFTFSLNLAKFQGTPELKE